GDNMKRLPDAEFEIMKAVWKSSPPVSTNEIIAVLDGDKRWKPQTVLTLLVRLIERDFLESEKVGRERVYTPIVTEEMYLQSETEQFMDKHYNNSLVGLVNTLYKGGDVSNEDIDELKDWLSKRS
ncbi:BlaI/MecI/CopY family transcriptional regulator, partial [Listeria cornellensis]